jgi:HEAT repeat protein
VRALLQSAADRMAMEVSDPEEVRKIMYTIVTAGPAAAEALRQTALDTGAGVLRIPALLTIAFSRDVSHVPALRSLFADKDAGIRREALTALTKVQPDAALEEARKLIQDPDETVALAAGEAYRMLGGEPLPEPAKARPAAAPRAAPTGAPKSAAKAASKPAAKPKAAAPADHGEHH